MPWFLGFFIWNLFPVVASLYLSLTDYNVLQSPNWVGLANYQELLGKDERFWASLRLTMAYSAITVPLGLVGSLCSPRRSSTRGCAASACGGPCTTCRPSCRPSSRPCCGGIMLLPTRSGLVNSATEPVWSLVQSDTPPRWFLDPDTVLWGFVIMSFWGMFGANTVIMLAGLKNIPRDLYEAAEVDGAGTSPEVPPHHNPAADADALLPPGYRHHRRHPDLRPGPVREGSRRRTFLNVYLYKQGFTFFHMGYASAIAWVMLVIILLLTLHHLPIEHGLGVLRG